MKNLKSEIKGVFRPPQKTYYFGKIRFGTPYFYPVNFNKHILSIRKLKLRSKYSYDKFVKGKNWLENKDRAKFSNLPMVRRCKDQIVKLFGNYYWVEIGWPIKTHYTSLGWKDKFESPRYEWQPQFHIFFFGLQFVIWWNAPMLDECVNNDKYYEMILHYLHYTDKNIEKAEKTWGWVDSLTGESTWDKKYLL